MNIIEAIIIGLIQGLTEFLPISSSGHLVIIQKILKINSSGNLIEVSAHLGTLLSIILIQKNEIWAIITSFKSSESSYSNFDGQDLPDPDEDDDSILDADDIVKEAPPAQKSSRKVRANVQSTKKKKAHQSRRRIIFEEDDNVAISLVKSDDEDFAAVEISQKQLDKDLHCERMFL